MSFLNIPDMRIGIFLSCFNKLLNFLDFVLSVEVVINSFGLVKRDPVIDNFGFVEFVLDRKKKYDFGSECEVCEILLVLLHLFDLDLFLFPLQPVHVLVVKGFVIHTVVFCSYPCADVRAKCAF